MNIRNGVASIFLEVKPLGGKRKGAVTEHRTRIDWAKVIRDILRYPKAK